MESIWIDAVEFNTKGGWKKESQFVREMGSSYLVANDVPGTPASDAETEITVNEEGWYRIFARTKNWKYPEAPGQFTVKVDGEETAHTLGKMPILYWYWDLAGDVYLKIGKHKIALSDKTGWLSRCAAIIITNDFDYTPSPEEKRWQKDRAEMKGISLKTKDYGSFDFAVVGAGPGGIPAAISAARHGLSVALISGRPTIGGNASDEGSIGLDGAGSHIKGYHETGIANEIKRVYEEFPDFTYQSALEYLVGKEKNITVFLNEICIDAESENGIIKNITLVNAETLERHTLSAPYFCDSTGDGWVGYFAGAKYRVGREAKHEYDENFAHEAPDLLTMSGCNCAPGVVRNFAAEDTGSPVEFVAPDWAIKFPKELYRKPQYKHTTEWWLENSNDYDDLWDSEFTRDAMVRLGIGYFDWRKNLYEEKEIFANYRLTELALHLSKRENRRIIGDYVLSQKDYTEQTEFPDAIGYHGWGIDIHHVKGIFSGAEGAFDRDKGVGVPPSPIPYRCLYSINIRNLFTASRCSSFTHMALGSTRVESTLALCGQAVGAAAYLCKKYEVLPRDIYLSHIKELQQTLICDDQTILGVKGEDEADKARCATVTATSFDKEEAAFPENVINGEIRSIEKNNAWISDKAKGLPQSITLELPKDEEISEIHITADTDLTLPRHSYWPVEVPFLHTLKDADIEILKDGEWKKIGEIRGNFIRKNKIVFAPEIAKAVRVTVLSASGEDVAKINEIRIY
ncbi:MAG: FAD-dependent oxidoreductase [Clostridia bacterium]|nr:FAD-dependent oxidoreductase [Clostridia bacterium]